ncbi:MAG: heat shock protein Hsp20 [Schlesneria sp.]|nr:heat shock protein Hsp20 [Schlesneria sp.]
MSNEIVKVMQTDAEQSIAPAADPVVFTPPIDIFETPDGLVLLADLPGVILESLELQVQDNKLTLFGKVKPDLPADARLIHQEYAVGHFLRSFILSDEVDHDRIAAKLNQGVLEVVLPQLRKSEPRRIQITVE